MALANFPKKMSRVLWIHGGTAPSAFQTVRDLLQNSSVSQGPITILIVMPAPPCCAAGRRFGAGAARRSIF
jgi:hypothetical protein